MRTASLHRKTNETDIRVSLNLDGTGEQKIATGIPFFDHMLAQVARHGHFEINGRKVNIPSFLCRSSDTIVVREKSRKITRVLESLGAVDRRGVPKWLQLDKDGFQGKLVGLPSREDLTMPIREQLIVELYSK